MNIKKRAESVFLAVLVAGALAASNAVAEPCTSATAVDGIRQCDDPNDDPDCPACTSATLGVLGTWDADFSSFPEAEDYLDSLDADVDEAEGVNYLEVIELGVSPGLEISLYDTSFFDPIWGPLESGVMTVVRMTADAHEPDVAAEKPAILLICGVHAHEWMPQETCLGYADWLVKAANGFGYAAPDQAYAQDLLERREIWMVVMANPAGRIWDEGISGTGEPFSENDWRKNRQWDESFQCDLHWEGAHGSGRCGSPVAWMLDGKDVTGDWYLAGVNIGGSFSTG